jgi:hypothetical protein
MGVNKIFNKAGMPDETQIDGEGALACQEAQEWFCRLRTHCVKIEAGNISATARLRFATASGRG